jgi:uncharacterized membrane protein
VAGVRNRWAIRWLRSQLPELVASGVITSENAQAIERHYTDDQPRTNFAFVILATLGSVLVAAGIILLSHITGMTWAEAPEQQSRSCRFL